ncbi:MAG TPA: FAD-dependent oxidoreductase [Arachnia sp.]|nr:FAD-dependent oxidoreductase [Arachnia sp.]HMT86619.1 FAD-dependent oxidoreductase [Arachnia sp.]
MAHDVVILGATIAGLTSARILARAGFDALVLDPNLELRSAGIGHGVAACGHVSTVANMGAAYGGDAAREHIRRNLEGMAQIRKVLAQAGQEPDERVLVDTTGTEALDFQEILSWFEDEGAECSLTAGGSLGAAMVTGALLLDPVGYAALLLAQAREAGAKAAHGVTVTHVRRREGHTDVLYRDNIAWASDLRVASGAVVVDTLGISPWGRAARIGPAQWVPMVRCTPREPLEEVQLIGGSGQAWMVRPDGAQHLVLGQKATLSAIDAATTALVAWVKEQDWVVDKVGRLAIDPSDHGRPVVGASAIPGGYYARGNGRGELMNGTASGTYLAQSLIGWRDAGRPLPLTSRMRAQSRKAGHRMLKRLGLS